MHDASHEYDENCEGCQPAILDIETGEVMSNDNPIMITILETFKKMPLERRRAWHRVVMQNSKNENDLRIAQEIGVEFSNAVNGQ